MALSHNTRQSRLSRIVRTLAICLLMCSAAAFIALSLRGLSIATDTSYGYPRHGTWDFVQYWSAFHALTADENPYDVETLAELQSTVGVPRQDPVVMWNPPWLPILLSPVLRGNFITSARCWLILNVVMVFIVAFWTTSLCRSSQCSSRTALVAAFFLVVGYPAFQDVMFFGQLGLFLSVGVLLTIKGAIERRPSLIGFGFAVMSIKPHLFVIFACFLLVSSLRETGLRGLLKVISIPSILVATSLLMNVETFRSWLSNVATRSHGSYRDLMSWNGATLPQILRGMIGDGGPTIIILCSAIAILGALFFASKIRLGKDRLLAYLNSFVCVSWLFSPYGWFSDSSVLSLPLAYTVMRLASQSRRAGAAYVLLSISVVQCFTSILPHLGFADQITLRFHPLITCLFYFTVLYLYKTDVSVSPIGAWSHHLANQRGERTMGARGSVDSDLETKDRR